MWTYKIIFNRKLNEYKRYGSIQGETYMDAFYAVLTRFNIQPHNVLSIKMWEVVSKE